MCRDEREWFIKRLSKQSKDEVDQQKKMYRKMRSPRGRRPAARKSRGRRR